MRDALLTRTHGSPKTQNIQNAVTHAQSSEPLACAASEQMSPVRKQRPVAHCLSIVRLLPRSTGIDARGQIRRENVEGLERQASALNRLNAWTLQGSLFSLCIRRV